MKTKKTSIPTVKIQRLLYGYYDILWIRGPAMVRKQVICLFIHLYFHCNSSVLFSWVTNRYFRNLQSYYVCYILPSTNLLPFIPRNEKAVDAIVSSPLAISRIERSRTFFFWCSPYFCLSGTYLHSIPCSPIFLSPSTIFMRRYHK